MFFFLLKICLENRTFNLTSNKANFMPIWVVIVNLTKLKSLVRNYYCYNNLTMYLESYLYIFVVWEKRLKNIFKRQNFDMRNHTYKFHNGIINLYFSLIKLQAWSWEVKRNELNVFKMEWRVSFDEFSFGEKISGRLVWTLNTGWRSLFHLSPHHIKGLQLSFLIPFFKFFILLYIFCLFFLLKNRVKFYKLKILIFKFKLF